MMGQQSRTESLFYCFRIMKLPQIEPLGCSGDEPKPEFWGELGCDSGPRHQPKGNCPRKFSFSMLHARESCTRSERVWIFRITA
jgi:hypothetical protein